MDNDGQILNFAKLCNLNLHETISPFWFPISDQVQQL